MIVGAGITPEEREAINRGEYRYNRWRERLAVMAKRPRPTPRWYPLIPHPEMIRCLLSPARFRVVVAWTNLSNLSQRCPRWLTRSP